MAGRALHDVAVILASFEAKNHASERIALTIVVTLTIGIGADARIVRAIDAGTFGMILRVARPAGVEPATRGLEGCVPVSETAYFQQVATTATRTCHAVDWPDPALGWRYAASSAAPAAIYGLVYY